MAVPRIDRESVELVADERGLEMVSLIIDRLRYVEANVQEIALAFDEDGAHYQKLQEALTYLSEVDESLTDAKKNRERAIRQS